MTQSTAFATAPAGEDPTGRARSAADRPSDGAEAAVHRLAEGVELLGVFQDSGFQVPKYLLRRGDGQVMQLPRLLYGVAGALDGRSAGEIATALSAELGVELTAGEVSFLVTDRLRPVGVIAADEDEHEEADRPPDGRGEPSPAAPVKSDPLLSLRYRVGVVPAGVVSRVAGVLRPLFARPVWPVALAVFIGVGVLIIQQGGLVDQLTAGLLQLIHKPSLILVVLALGVVGSVFHECGHVTACRYGGATPGDMGVGLYIVWPAFYSTVTDSYRLSRVGRLRTDLGGVYFDAIFMAGFGGLYLATGQPWLLLAVLSMLVETAYQFFPSIRFDGYYILADLVGVPDLFGYVGPVLTRLLPGRRTTHPKVRELRPWARRVIVLWVVLSVPVILLGLSIWIIAAPTVIPLLWPAVQEYLATVDAAVRNGEVVTTALGVLQLFLLVLPWLGSVLIFWNLITLAYRLAGRRWERLRVPAATASRVRGILALTTVSCLAAAVVVRVAVVAGSLPASVGENRLIASAVAAVEGVSTGPSVSPAQFLAGEQLEWYARVTSAFSRHDSVLAGGRELAVVAAAVLVVCLAALAFTHRLRPGTVVLPLGAALVMGPVVTVLATVGPGVLGAAWTALGALLLTGVAGRAGAWVGVLAVTLGVLTAPVTAVPLALGLILLLVGGRTTAGRQGLWHAWPEEDRPSLRRWLLVAPVLSVVGLVSYLGTTPGDLPVDSAVRTVLVILAALVVAVALRDRSLRPLAGGAGAAVVLAVLPWPGAASALPGAVAAVVLLGALLLHTRSGRPPEQRAHPLARAAVAVPVLVLVVVGALFLPATAPGSPTAELASWITGPSSGGGTVAVPASLWAQLVRDGVPPDRLTSGDPPTGSAAGWTVGVGSQGPGQQPVATFGDGRAALTVRPVRPGG